LAKPAVKLAAQDAYIQKSRTTLKLDKTPYNYSFIVSYKETIYMALFVFADGSEASFCYGRFVDA
jgi:hypothetical protein